MKSITGMVLSLQYWYVSVDDICQKSFQLKKYLQNYRKKSKGLVFFYGLFISPMYCFNDSQLPTFCFIDTREMCTDPDRLLESQVTANNFGNMKLQQLREAKQTCQGEHVTYSNK